MGGFSALGNPASFHNMVVRRFREWAHAIVVDEVFRDVVGEMSSAEFPEWKLEQKVERLTIRNAGKTPSRECWHRDEAKIMTTPHDVVSYSTFKFRNTMSFWMKCAPNCKSKIPIRLG